MMKKLTLSAIALAATACDMTVGIDPNLNTELHYYEMFVGTLNGEEVSFNNAVYECREPERFVYRRPTEQNLSPADVTNSDGSLVPCETQLFYKVYSDEEERTMVID